MASFAQALAEYQRLLAPGGYTLVETATKIVFTAPAFGSPIFAVPDVHLGDARGGDIFLDGKPEKARKLAAVLDAILQYQLMHPQASRAVQLGDWFDIWRVCGSDPTTMAYGAIQDAPAYADVLRLDAQLGLAHVIGNHDAGFLRSLPDRRVTQPHLFRLGFWLGSNVYTLHGHQTDLAPPAGSTFDEVSVAAATAIGRYVPGVTTFEAYVDRLGFGGGVAQWLLDAFGIREDPGPQARPVDRAPAPESVRSGSFVVRENLDALATVVEKVERLPESHGRAASVVIVGHSHTPGASWTDVTGRPVFFVDAGAWAYDQANLLIAADDTIAVFDVVSP